MRCFSFILFAAMAAVLPMAGLQRYFCTMNMEFVNSAEDCSKEEKSCCAKKEKHEPTAPDCMASAKLLPNANKSTPVQIPAADGVWAMVPVVIREFVPARCVERVFPEKERGPPDGSRLFIAQRRLLI
jgi:hypothetical protein